MTDARDLEPLLRDLAPEVLGRLVRRFRDLDSCEDAVQEALIAAARQWPGGGIPDNPAGWLYTVAVRRWIEAWRRDTARERREAATVDEAAPDPGPSADDSLTLLFLCCHPALTPPSQVALTLRAVGGLTTAEIARGFLVPEATIGQRISRAKASIRAAGVEFRLPSPDELPARLAAVRQVLYLVFTEGHTASAGDLLVRVDLSSDAIRLARQLHAAYPDDGETTGLLALMLLTDARRPARTTPDGTLVPLADQDRRRWDGLAIAEGLDLIRRSLAEVAVGPYQLQAAIAAVHAEATRAEDTDWPQVLALYGLLDRIAPGPMVTLNGVVALAMVEGPETALRELDRAAGRDEVLARHYRLQAVRAHLLERAGDTAGALVAYREAARTTLSVPERRYLETRASRLPALGQRRP